MQRKQTSRSLITAWLTPLILLSLTAVFSYFLTVFVTQLELTTLPSTPPVNEENDTAVSDSPTRAALPTPTPLPPGRSRANPLSRDQLVTMPNWDLQLLDAELVRGEESWQMLREANFLNEPPDEGWEYLLIQVWVKSKGEGEDMQNLSLSITGDQNVVHFGFDSGVVSPEPMLETHLLPGWESEGWEAFRIREGEKNLLLVVEDLYLYEDDLRYVALEPGASIAVPAAALNFIQPNQIGLSPDQPAPFGKTAVTDDWQISIQEVIRGEDAWAIILDTNQFNDPPPHGMEYLLIKVRGRYIGTDEGPHNLSRYDFWLLDDTDAEYEIPSVVHPEPELYFELFPGGEVEGWIVMQGAAK